MKSRKGVVYALISTSDGPDSVASFLSLKVWKEWESGI